MFISLKFFFLFFFFTTFFFFAAGFFVSLALGLVLAFTVGVALGLGEVVAATAEVIDKVRIEMRNVATNFFNLCSI